MMLALAATTLMTACSKDENEMDNWNGEIRLSSGIEVQTRAYTPTQGTQIVNGEVVSVWVDDAKTPTTTVTTENLYKARQLTANNGSFTGTAMYFPQTGNKVNIFAMHGIFDPVFKEGDAFPTSGATYTVNANQSVNADYIKSDLLYAYSPAVARTNSSVPLTFYHMLSKLEVAIKIGDGAPALKSSGAVSLSSVTTNGKFTPGKPADMSVQSARAAMLGAAGTPVLSDMTLGQTTCADFATNVNYNEAILVPQSMSGKTLTFTLADGGTLSYTFPSSTTFESGKRYTYHITLKLTGLVVTSSIENWDPITSNPVTGDATM